MTKEEIIKYIRKYDAFFNDAHLETYPYHELMLIKKSIDVEKSKDIDFKPMGSIQNVIGEQFRSEMKHLEFTSEESE